MNNDRFMKYAARATAILVIVLLAALFYLASEKYKLNQRYTEQIERMVRHNDEQQEQTARHTADLAKYHQERMAALGRLNEVIEEAQHKIRD